MTIDHASAVWGEGTITDATLPGGQPALRTGRLFPVAPSDVAGSSASIRPYATPWLAAADRFGVAFPAGLVGVASSIAIPGAWGGTLNAGYESAWSDLTSGATIIPVPGVLPSGYAANLDTPWASTSIPLLRLRTAAGFTTQSWGPTSNPNGVTTSKRTDNLAGGDAVVTFDGTSTHALVQILTGTGFRKLQFRLRYFTGAPVGGPMPPDSIDMKVSHNNNTGTVPPSTNDGDTIDHSTTIASGSMSYAGGSYTTSWIDAGAVLAKTGVVTTFVHTAVSVTMLSYYIDYQLSPRVDVPYVLTVTGQGDLVAPGGYPT